MQAVLAKKYDIKTQRSGHGKNADGNNKPSEGQVLCRVVRQTSQGFELEADLRHTELIVEQLGLQDAKEVSTRGSSEGLQRAATTFGQTDPTSSTRSKRAAEWRRGPPPDPGSS